MGLPYLAGDGRRDDPRRPRRHGRVADAAARAAGDDARGREPAADPGRGTRARRTSTRPRPRAGAARSSGARGRPPSPASRCSSCSPLRWRPAAGLPRRGHDAAGTTTRRPRAHGPRGFGPGAAGTAAARRRRGAGARGGAHRRGARRHRVRRRSRGRPGRRHGDAHRRRRPGPSAGGPRTTLERVRERAVPFDVGGVTAALVDQSETTAARLPAVHTGSSSACRSWLLVAAFRSRSSP
jgi:hypothetical protein